MALYAIKPLLVTRSIVHKRFMKPPATLNSRMLADQVIFLIGKNSFEFCGNLCLQACVTVALASSLDSVL